MIISVSISMLVFAVLYALKGGSGPVVFTNWEKIRQRNIVFKYLLGGKFLSTLIAFIFTSVATQDLISSFLFALAWLAAIAPSMGEEHGAVGRYGRAWGEYIDKAFGRTYGIHKAIQRGVWSGACMAVATGFTPFIYFSLLFVPTVFIGQEINYRVYKEDGWRLAEPIIGAVVFGIPTGLLLST